MHGEYAEPQNAQAQTAVIELKAVRDTHQALVQVNSNARSSQHYRRNIRRRRQRDTPPKLSFSRLEKEPEDGTRSCAYAFS
jgi:hypothetical protein